MNILWLFLLVASASWALTGLLRFYAQAKSLMDVPNERSSHSVPTPRGGGISIVFTFLLGLLYLWVSTLLGTRTFIALFCAGIVVAIIGFVDDHEHIAARWRLLGHFIAAAWLVFWLGGIPTLNLFGVIVGPGWAGHILIVIALVWLLNLYNFMDGIDGIAGIEALSSTLVVALLFLFVFDNQEMAVLSLLMFAAVLGFFIWNYPPAKIFMGDVGSGFLGLMLGALAVYGAYVETVVLWVWFILLGVFIVDSTYTLCHRLLRGDRIYEAHCGHAYQYASRKYGSHLLVTLTVLVINLCWLTPWAIVVSLDMIDGASGLVMAYVPLVWLAWYFKAGEKEKN